ncbi:MAG: Hsp20/alpha crystallin family protein [Nitrospirae bacterium YQR-1]
MAVSAVFKQAGKDYIMKKATVSEITNIKECMFYSTDAARAMPLMDIYETDDLLVFEIDAPGIILEEVNVKVCDDLVVIEGDRRKTTRSEGSRFLCMERCYDHFKRVVKLPVKVNVATGKAVYSKGVIRLTFEKIKDRVIQITIERGTIGD